MSVSVLTECAKELRRLSIAGSQFARDDHRLARLIEPLKESGKKAPVFAKVAEAIEELVTAEPQGSADKLLAAATLVNAILYTQGIPDVEGKLEAIGRADVPVVARPDPAEIRPVLNALRGKGPDKHMTIIKAHHAGLFDDFRLFRPALDGVMNSNADIGRFVAWDILPDYGKAALPYLLADLDLKGRGPDARRIEAIAKIAGGDACEILLRALEEGSNTVRESALEALGEITEPLDQVLPRLKHKKKDIREGAILSLSRIRERGSIKALFDLLSEPKTAVLAATSLSMMSEAVRDDESVSRDDEALVAEIGRHALKLFQDSATQFLKPDDAKAVSYHADAVRNALVVLKSARPEGMSGPLLQVFQSRDSYQAVDVGSQEGQRLVKEVMLALREADDEATLKVLAETPVDGDFTREVVCMAARKLYTPDEFYERFKSVYEDSIDKPGRTPRMTYTLVSYSQRDLSVLCRKWLDLAIAHEDERLIREFSATGDKKCIDFYRSRYDTADSARERLKALTQLNECRAPDVVRLMEMEIAGIAGHPEVLLDLLNLITNTLKNAFVLELEGQLDSYENQYIADCIIEEANRIRAGEREHHE